MRVGIVGAGFMGRGLMRQIHRSVPGMRVVAVANRTVERARDALCAAGHETVYDASDPDGLARAIDEAVPAVTDDPALLCSSPEVDVLVEATGAIAFGAHVLTDAIQQRKDVVSMNAELDATVGPWLQAMAHQMGTIVSGCDGDQPGAQMNLMRSVRGLGLRPLVAGNVKGLQDRYRTPETQASFAAKWGQTPTMVTSFADGTKISFEQALVANAADMGIARSGMLGPHHDGHVDDLAATYLASIDIDGLRELGGIVDYVVGAKPGPGVFVLAALEDPDQEIYLRYGKLGEGPLYSFYIPYHLTVLEVPLSVARVALFRDHVIAPAAGAPRVEVVARAKRDLRAGEVLDGVGGFMTYGTCERHRDAREQALVPIGVAEGARLTRDVRRDAALTEDDLELEEDRLVIRLWRRQTTVLHGEAEPPGANASSEMRT